MIQVIVIHDNQDAKCGECFAGSQEWFVSQVKDLKGITIEVFDTDKCQNKPIQNYIQSLNGIPFIFIAYVHGSDDTLFVDDEEYINSANAYFFGETLFYACSCLSANELGIQLRQEGCRVFAGYKTKISTISNETEPLFSMCENAFITHFLSTGNTLQDSLSFMYDKYQEAEIHLRNNYSVFEASKLQSNLDAFEILCEENDMILTRDAFSYENY